MLCIQYIKFTPTDCQKHTNELSITLQTTSITKLYKQKRNMQIWEDSVVVQV